MNRNDFTVGSVSQVIFDYWDKALTDEGLFLALLMKQKHELVDFITEMQSKGCFKGYIHE
jgi:hypothetical protein